VENLLRAAMTAQKYCRITSEAPETQEIPARELNFDYHKSSDDLS
jgi:hypothetical protein